MTAAVSLQRVHGVARLLYTMYIMSIHGSKTGIMSNPRRVRQFFGQTRGKAFDIGCCSRGFPGIRRRESSTPNEGKVARPRRSVERALLLPRNQAGDRLSRRRTVPLLRCSQVAAGAPNKSLLAVFPGDQAWAELQRKLRFEAQVVINLLKEWPQGDHEAFGGDGGRVEVLDFGGPYAER